MMARVETVIKNKKKEKKEWFYNTANEGDGLAMLDWVGKEKAQLVIFDPQYKPVSEATSLDAPHEDQSEENIREFCYKIGKVLKKAGWLCLWINQEILLRGNFRQWLPPNLIVKTVLVWTKRQGNNLKSAMGQVHNHFIHLEEYCVVIRKEPWEKPMIKKRISNIFNYFIPTNKRHNTHMKPYKMTRTIIKHLTKKGDLVIDPCAGSFATLVACESIGRKFLGTDLCLGEQLRFNIHRENTRKLLEGTRKEVYDN